MIVCLSDLWPPFPGGAERLMFNLARDLLRRGMPVHTVTGYEAALQHDGPPVTALPIGVGPTHAEGAAMLAAALAQLHPDVILTHHHYAMEFEAELVATGVPLVQVVLNGHRIPQAALAVYISRWVRGQVGGAQPQDLVLTPPAFPDIVAGRHGPHIGMVKPLTHKGIDLLYQLAELLPDRSFLVLRGEWQTLEDIRVYPNVAFMDPVVDMRDFYAECRLLLVPSRSEDAGTVAQEAALNGLPCLASNVGGLAETNRGGLLLPPDVPRAWVRAIRKLDAPRTYQALAARQRAYLDRTNHAGTLDVLAERIAGLWTPS